jgi:hypothetical protein
MKYRRDGAANRGARKGKEVAQTWSYNLGAPGSVRQGSQHRNPLRKAFCDTLRSIGKHFPGLVIQRMPQPAGSSFAAHKGPHFIPLCCHHFLDYHSGVRTCERCERRRIDAVELRLFFFSSLITVPGLTPNTRAVSRIPLPLSAISTIRFLTSGCRPLSSYVSKKIVRLQCEF